MPRFIGHQCLSTVFCLCALSINSDTDAPPFHDTKSPCTLYLHLLSSIWHLQWNPHNLSFEHTYIKPRVNKRPQGYSCEDDNAYKNHVILVQRQTARDILLAQKVTHEHLTHDTVVARSPTHKTLMVEKKKKKWHSSAFCLYECLPAWFVSALFNVW